MTTQPSFQQMVKTATGHDPYEYQTRLAEDGLTELLCAPTGAGKTLASILPWLWRRRFHPDPSIRSSTPRRLAYALPMRTLVEQTSNKAHEWVANLDLEDGIGVYTLMGGESRKGDAWRLRPESDAIIVGTIDMLLSRALNRGSASRPSLGLSASGCSITTPTGYLTKFSFWGLPFQPHANCMPFAKN